jgi:hypothetical protein
MAESGRPASRLWRRRSAPCRSVSGRIRRTGAAGDSAGAGDSDRAGDSDGGSAGSALAVASRGNRAARGETAGVFRPLEFRIVGSAGGAVASPAAHKSRRHTSAGGIQVPAAQSRDSRHRAGLSQTVSGGSGLLQSHALFALFALFTPTLRARSALGFGACPKATGLGGLGPAPKPVRPVRACRSESVRAQRLSPLHLGGWGLLQRHGLF